MSRVMNRRHFLKALGGLALIASVPGLARPAKTTAKTSPTNKSKMSRLIYNGVELSYIRTQSVEFSPKYDDTGVDYLWTEVNLSVEAVFNTLLLPANPGETPAQTMVRVRGLLESPRKQLQFFVGNDLLVNSAGGRDVANGPLPAPVSITQIGGSASFLVTYKITTFIAECPAGQAPPDYQSHRWKETVKIDENFYTRKIRTGKVHTRSDINSNADALRGLIIPAIDTGFKVTEIEVTLQEDGLALMYSWTEQEVFLQPPNPSSKAEGDYIESTSTPGGAVRFAESRIKLEGPKTADKGQLLAQAILIALTTISPDEPIATSSNLNGNAFLRSASVKTNLYENKVEVSLKCMIKSSKDMTKDFPMNLKRFSFPPAGSAPGTPPPDPGDRGSAGLQLFSNALADPCMGEIILRSQGLLGQENSLSTTGLPEVRVLSTTVLPDEQRALYSTTLDSLPGFYTHYRVMTTYPVKTWNAQLPVASPGTTSAFVTLAGTVAGKIVEWVAEKIGSPPKIPDPNVLDPNLVLLKATITPETELGDGDGTLLTFHRSGRYEYGFVDYTQAVLDGGMPPFIDPSVRSLSTISSDDFIHGIIDQDPSQDHSLTTQRVRAS